MHSSLFKIAILCCALLLSSAPGVSAQDKTEIYDDITSQMETIRQLELSEPLNISSKSGAELRQELLDSLEADYPADEQRADTLVWVAFGFIEPDQDLVAIEVDLYSEQVAGYYDPSTGEMVVIVNEGDEELTASDKVTFAHEVVHALQDQNFDLTTYDDIRLDGTSDSSLAVTALIEGDDTLGMIDYLLANPDVTRDYLAGIGSDEMSSAALDGAPAMLSAPLLFPYDQGQVFVQTLFDDGGWDAVNAAYANPPTTTEQILHPEKYIDNEQAVSVALPDLGGVLGPEWTTLDVDTMGEFQISVLLGDDVLSDEQVERGSEGWGGDTYTVAANADDEVVVAWQSTWDSDDDAEQFANVLAVRETKRFDADGDSEGDTVTIESDEAVVHIIRDGDTVTYVQAPDQAAVTTVLDGLD
jgi:hypothetical protein